MTEVYVGEYKTMISCRGTGEPTILLENGLDYNSWGNTWGAIPFWEISRTCYYLRVGMSSGRAPGPRTTLDQVKDLHSILEQTGIPGPYILVGHSMAGFNLLVYTEQYPEDVVGLVCVDCRYPAVEAIFLNKLKQDFAADAKAEEKIRTLTKEYFLTATDPSIVYYSKEGLDLYNSSKQVMQVSSLGNRPFIVLVALTPMATPVPDKVKTDQLYYQSWLEAAEKLSQLSTQGRVEVVPNVTHMSILMDSAINRAIQEVYDKVTQP